MVKSIKPQAFDIELEGGSGLLLVAFLKRNERFAFQAEAVDSVEQARGDKVRCFLFNADYLDTAMERFAVKGTPTFILFDHGREVGRLIGESDSDALNEFLGNYIG
jgi:thioredoxin-related protein